MDDLTDDRDDGALEGLHQPEPDGDFPPGDADLVAQVRDGLDEPYAELYRRHQPAALSLARTLTEHAGADDVVSEAFEKLFLRIREGGGPEAAFRPYLLRTVRTVAVDASRRTRRLVVSEDPGDAGHAPTSEGDDLVDSLHERTTLARAFTALPERWQTFLWLSFVDDADRSEIAEILGINVGSVSALGYRAREGLRRAYLDAHLRDAPTPDCNEVWPLLAGAIRGGLGQVQQEHVDQHLSSCDHCRSALAELRAVNTRFGAVLAPIVLGAAAPAYLAAVQEGGRAAAAGLGPSVDAAAAAPVGAPAAASVAEAGTGAAQGVSGLKATLAGLSKVSAASVAVVACVSTVAFVALLAFLTAPLASEPRVAPRPGITTAGDSDTPGGVDTDNPDSTSGSSPSSSTSVGDPSLPTSGDPSTSGVPTTGGPTTGGPTTGGPTGQPTTGGPTGHPTQPTGGPTTPGGPPAPTQGPTSGLPTSGPPTSSSPSPTPTAARKVEAGLGSISILEQTSSSTQVHIKVPVSLENGGADLEITVSVRGLNKFTTTHAGSEGNWACVATTPMAGANKLGVVRCTIANASPGDPLDLGMNLGYSGEGSVTAVLSVSGAEDTSSSDDSVSAPLP